MVIKGLQTPKKQNRSKTPPEHSFALAAGSEGTSGWLSAQACVSSRCWTWDSPGQAVTLPGSLQVHA